MTEYDMIETMEVYGGGFVKALARCWRAADADNRLKLYAAFKELFEQYTEMAKEIERRKP